MRIGPFNSFHISQLEELFKKNNVQYSLFQDPEALKKIRESEVQRSPTRFPLYQSNGDYIYVDLQETDVDALRAELETFGVIFVAHHEMQDLESEEYYCVSCDSTSDSAGFCHKHQTRLVTFSEWAAQKSKNPQKNYILFMIAAVAAFLSLVVWYFRAI